MYDRAPQLPGLMTCISDGQVGFLLLRPILLLGRFYKTTPTSYYFIDQLSTQCSSRVIREAIKSHNRLTFGNHPNGGGWGGLGDEGGFPTSYFCYYNLRKKEIFFPTWWGDGGGVCVGWFPKFNRL